MVICHCHFCRKVTDRQYFATAEDFQEVEEIDGMTHSFDGVCEECEKKENHKKEHKDE